MASERDFPIQNAPTDNKVSAMSKAAGVMCLLYFLAFARVAAPRTTRAATLFTAGL